MHISLIIILAVIAMVAITIAITYYRSNFLGPHRSTYHKKGPLIESVYYQRSSYIYQGSRARLIIHNHTKEPIKCIVVKQRYLQMGIETYICLQHIPPGTKTCDDYVASNSKECCQHWRYDESLIDVHSCGSFSLSFAVLTEEAIFICSPLLVTAIGCITGEQYIDIVEWSKYPHKIMTKKLGDGF